MILVNSKLLNRMQMWSALSIVLNTIAFIPMKMAMTYVALLKLLLPRIEMEKQETSA